MKITPSLSLVPSFGFRCFEQIERQQYITQSESTVDNVNITNTIRQEQLVDDTITDDKNYFDIVFNNTIQKKFTLAQ